jgi:catabolite regulation protein CreA
MVCYQVLAQFTFHQHRPALVSTHVKKQNAKVFLVRSSLPFGSGLKYRRFFHSKKEATRYASYLHAVYKGRIIPNPALPGGQLVFNF